MVSGWSAGGNLAAGVARMARDADAPHVLGQVLLTPVTEFAFATPSYKENGEGYVLTADLMRWFIDHYIEPKDRGDKRANLLAGDHKRLPPAFIVTAEFDPLRDEGAAYAAKLKAAGVEVTHVPARGQVHTSIPMVDVLPTGALYRAQMADAIKRFAASGD